MLLLSLHTSEKPMESPLLLRPYGMGICLIHFNYKIDEFVVTLSLIFVGEICFNFVSERNTALHALPPTCYAMIFTISMM